MYFVEEGTLCVMITKQGRQQEVARLDKGRYFGEVALIEDKPRCVWVGGSRSLRIRFENLA